MKVLLENRTPFMLAPGGAQVQIEQTKAALERLGLEVEFLRWWDANQTGDVLHHFARIPTYQQRLAQRKGMKVVMSAIMSGLGARPGWLRGAQKFALGFARPLAPQSVRDLFGWDSYGLLDAILALTPYEASLLTRVHNAPPSRVHVIPNGVEDVFLNSQPAARGKWLVCTANILAMKRVLELAQMAVQASTPVWIIGKPHSEEEDYPKRFREFARLHPEMVRYEGAITDRSQLGRIYREARGFVLLSEWESLSVSALEAAACECPLLLSDLPWAHDAFKDTATYAPVKESVAAGAVRLRSFYDAAPNAPAAAKPLSWLDVGRQIKAVYESILAK